ncbi:MULTISPECIES: hypothetical protein [Pseudomonas]|uniref:hypothetical protein n=1 Tax=Pseudomonas TaxID=286 RepID=UPI002869E532|nr:MULTISPECIES: hypothetical protein [Pseudomonas]
MMQFALSSELVALEWGNIDWQREEVMVSWAMTQASKGKDEATKTIAERRSVKFLRPAMDALTAQKAHTFLADTEVFQIPSHAEALGRRWANPKNDVGCQQ